jgi:hypothetical protein
MAAPLHDGAVHPRRERAMKYVQLVEYSTSKPDEVDQLMSGWVSATQGKRTATRSMTGRDRDGSNAYVEIVEFPSYEEAMRNSELSETGVFAEKIAKLCESGPEFRNLDVVREDSL